MVKVKGLQKVFSLERGQVRAVNGVDLHIHKQEFFTLLGPSGSGKSSILRCIAGLEVPDGGSIEIGDKTVFSKEANRFVLPNERDISMVFQSYAIWPHMTVYGNVSYPLLGKMSKKAAREKVMESLKMVGMEHLEKRPVPLLSGGQQQRVALARAIAKSANVLLLDEPLSNLDARLRTSMRVELRELQKRLGITAIYVTHDQEEALAMSDRVAVLNQGEIVELGPPQSLYRHPKTKFSATFLGLCNLLRGNVIGKTSSGMLLARTAFGEVECLGAEKPADNVDVLISIRPEYIVSSKRPFLEGRNVFDGIIVSTTFLGRLFDCMVSVGEQEIRVEIPSSEDVKQGDRIYLHFPPRLCVTLPKD